MLDNFAEKLVAFQSDRAIPFATYPGGSVASYNPALDGGGLGDLLNIVGQQALDALSAGCRLHSPHVPVGGTVWRYGAVLDRAGLCNAEDGWNCVFEDVLMRRPDSEAGGGVEAEATGPEELKHLDASHCPGGREALRRHHLEADAKGSIRVTNVGAGTSAGALCPMACMVANGREECGRGLLALWCSRHVGGCPRPSMTRNSSRLIAQLLAAPFCTANEWPKAHLISLLWQLAPPLARHVDRVRKTSLPAEVRAPLPPPVASDVGGSSAAAAGHLPAAAPYVGVHVRRGDACRCVRACCWSNADGNGRVCVPSDEYIRASVEAAAAIGARHVYLATEDAGEVEYMSAMLRAAGLQPMSQLWDRKTYTVATQRGSCERDHGFVRIEDAMDTAALDAEGAVLSAVADVQMLAEAGALVGGLSAFTTLAHRLGSARAGGPMLFIDVDNPSARAERASRRAAATSTPVASNSATGATTCPTRAELVRALDLDGSGTLSRCEANFLYTPLAALARRRGSPPPSELAPGCEALYRCFMTTPAVVTEVSPPTQVQAGAKGEAALLAGEEALLVDASTTSDVRQPEAVDPTDKEAVNHPEQGTDHPEHALAGSDLAAQSTDWDAHSDGGVAWIDGAEQAETEIGHACARDDLGPWPCLESGCDVHGVVISCARLAGGGVCDQLFRNVWERPQRWIAHMRVWEACPHACGLCGRTTTRRGRGARNSMGSCDA